MLHTRVLIRLNNLSGNVCFGLACQNQLTTYVPVVIFVKKCNINKYHNHFILMSNQCLLGSRLDQIFSPSIATTSSLFLTIIRDIQLGRNFLHSVHLTLPQQPRKHLVSLARPVNLCQTTAHSSNVTQRVM